MKLLQLSNICIIDVCCNIVIILKLDDNKGL